MMTRSWFNLASAGLVRAVLLPVLVLLLLAAVPPLRADDEQPSFTVQPVSLTVTQAADATFSVLASGAEPLTYQWFFNETNSLADATNATFTITDTQQVVTVSDTNNAVGQAFYRVSVQK